MLYAGCDWSDGWVDVAVQNDAGAVLAECRIVYADHRDPVAAYCDFLRSLHRRWRSTVTGIEDTGILWARVLAGRGMTVVHADPTLAARHRKAAGTAKSDRADARTIATMVRTGVCRPVVPGSAAIQALRAVTHAHRAAVVERAAAQHALRAVLVKVWPAAARAWSTSVGGLRYAQARAVLAAAPGPRAAARLSRAQLEQVLREAGRTRTVAAEAERLRLLFSRPALLLDPEIEDGESVRIGDLVAVLDHAVHRTETLERQMHQRYTAHPMHHIVDSVPGIGPVLGAYLLAEIGDSPGERFSDGRALAAYAGMSPVTWASGTVTRVAFRRASSRELRATGHAAAFCVVQQSPGANAYYRSRRAAGDMHSTALRKVGRRLMLCLHHCLTTGVLYDDAVAFGYDPDAPDAPVRARRPPLTPEQMAQARDMLAVPGTSARSVGIALSVSALTISRHVLGKPRTPPT